MVAITSDPAAHSFASTRLYEVSSGAQVTISFAIPASDGLLTVEAATRIRESIANLIAAGFSATAPGLEAGEEREEIGYVIRYNKTNNDGSKSARIFFYPPAQNLVYKVTDKYLDTPQDIIDFEAASGLKLDKLPAWVTKAAPKRDDPDAKDFFTPVAKPFKVVFKANPAYTGPGDKEHTSTIFLRYEGEPVRPTSPNQQPPQRSNGSGQQGSGNGGSDEKIAGWISPATWVKTREDWDAFLASALEKFKMDADAVDTALRKLATCEGLGDWHQSRGWALAALIAAAHKYDAKAIDAYTSTIPGDPNKNQELDRMAKQITVCKSEPDDEFAKQFGGDDPMGRKAIAAELRNEMVVITSIERDQTKRGHDMWIGRAPMEDSSEPLRIILFKEDLRAIKNAGYTVEIPSLGAPMTTGIEIAVTTKHNATTGWRIDNVLPPTMAMDSESA